MSLRTLPSFALTAATILSMACSVESSPAGAADTDQPDDGKADGVRDAAFCPDNVTLNSAPGSSKRCVDEDTGQFVASECCFDVCAGAGWRDQSNGRVCAWTGEPGLAGATQGQFAPTMCCELQDDLACGRAEGVRGGCTDAQTGRAVEDGCCELLPAECHPTMNSILSGCVFEQLDEIPEDSERLMPRLSEIFTECATEADLAAPRIDSRCSFQPDLPFCGLEFEQVDAQFVQPCLEQLLPEYNCTFGLEYPDIFNQQHLLIVSKESLDLEGALAADPLTQEQIIAAGRSTDAGDNLADVIESTDERAVSKTEIFDASNGRSYTAYEYGAGDNGFGAIFERGESEILSAIIDSFLEEPSGEFLESCSVDAGPGGTPCGGGTACADGFQCQGTIDHPTFGELGRCIDPQLGSATAGDDCSSLNDCGDGNYCAGLSQDFGLCSPGWMFGQVGGNFAFDNVPDGGRTESALFIYGAASVPVDLSTRFQLFHEQDASQLRATLIGPLGDEGAILTLFDGATADLEPGQTSVTIDMPVPHSGDEDINGRWTLVVEDEAGNGSGDVFNFQLQYSSRFD